VGYTPLHSLTSQSMNEGSDLILSSGGGVARFAPARQGRGLGLLMK
jgi:hypothetical protein